MGSHREYSNTALFNDVKGKTSFFKGVEMYVNENSDSFAPEMFQSLYKVGAEKGFDEETVEIAVMKACKEKNNYGFAKMFTNFIRETRGSLRPGVLFQFLAICANTSEVIF